MRIVVTSDLHCGQGISLETDIRNALKLTEHAAGADLFVLAGDLGESARSVHTLERTLEAFAVVGPRAALGGNHDMAVGPGSPLTSDELYPEHFEQLCRRHGYTCLETLNARVGDTALVGTIGPVAQHLSVPGPAEYSAAYHRFRSGSLHDFQERRLDSFRARLLQAESDTSVRRILVVSHVPPALPRQEATAFWTAILQAKKTALVVYGDTHQSFPDDRRDGIPVIPTMSGPGSYASLVVDLPDDRPPVVGRRRLFDDAPVPVRV